MLDRASEFFSTGEIAMFCRRFALQLALCAVSVLLVSSSASAQVIYEPVQYQYKASQYYYYGGTNPAVHEYAASPVGGAGRWGRANGYAFVSATRAVVNEPLRAFTDGLPFTNAAIYGFTPADASNEANFNLPRYFRKGDLLNAAVPVDGAFVVPAQAQPIRFDRDTVRYTRPNPATAPRPMMIIPKPRPQPSDKALAANR